jgi:outer membrane receptor protein involved in Fe transport
MRERLLASSILCGAALLAAAAATPAAAADAASGSSEVSEIVVTGSRIARPNFDSPVPVSVVDSRLIQNSGSISTGDIIRQLPSAGVSTITPTNSGFQTAANGITTVNLRNLGEERTLVLVNGRRFVPGLVGTQAVDFNSIPTEIIDRVDVVTGGASSIYGSDALAGVVNIITKQNFEGVVVNGQYGISERGDDVTGKFSVTAGSRFADDKGSAMFTVGYDRTGAVFAHSRCDQDMCIDGANTWDPDVGGQSYRGTFTPVYSTTPPIGAILIGRPGAGNLTRVLDNGVVRPFDSVADGFNRQAFRILQVPDKRITFNGQFNYEINKAAQIFEEVTYVHHRLFSDIEPTPLSSSQLFDNSTPFCNATGCTNGIPLTSASVPEAVKAAVRAANPGLPDSALVVGFRRRLNEIGDRGNELERSTFRTVTGLRGDTGFQNWHYEVSLNYGRTDEQQQTNGEVNIFNFRNALNSTVIDGQVVCADPTARAAGCVPLNVFGLGSITPEAANYVRSASGRTSRIEEYVINGFAAGDLFELPAGMTRASVGAEYRQEKSSDIPDPLTQIGGTSGNLAPATVGQFDVYELFGELQVPVLKDLPFVKSLDVNLSGRFSDYSTVGRTDAYAASIEYNPIESLKFRAQYSRAVRAPNVGELFSPALQDFPTVVDPCAGVTRTADGKAAFLNKRQNLTDPTAVLQSGVNGGTIGDAVATACLADPAVAARVTRDGGLSLTQSEAQGVTGFDGGNPDLKAEKGDTWTVGLLFNPRSWGHWWAPLSLSVDWYHIKIKDRIAVVDEQVELDKCYTGGTFNAGSTFCSQVVRFQQGNASVGALFAVNQRNGNFASSTTEGLDVQLSYRLDFMDVPYLNGLTNDPGNLTTSVIYSRLNKSDITPFTGAEASDIIHEAGLVGFSKNKAQINLIYSRHPIEWTIQMNYIGDATLDTDPNGFFFGAKIPARWFTNTQLRWDLTDKATFFAGVDNLFDEYVRIGGTNGDTGQATGWTTYPDVYDGLGRRYYGGFRLRF